MIPLHLFLYSSPHSSTCISVPPYLPSYYRCLVFILRHFFILPFLPSFLLLPFPLFSHLLLLCHTFHKLLPHKSGGTTVRPSVIYLVLLPFFVLPLPFQPQPRSIVKTSVRKPAVFIITCNQRWHSTSEIGHDPFPLRLPNYPLITELMAPDLSRTFTAPDNSGPSPLSLQQRSLLVLYFPCHVCKNDDMSGFCITYTSRRL